MKIRNLLEFLPISRRKYTQALGNMIIVVNGLIEADANHCQIETSLIQEITKSRSKKPAKEKNHNDVAFV